MILLISNSSLLFFYFFDELYFCEELKKERDQWRLEANRAKIEVLKMAPESSNSAINLAFKKNISCSTGTDIRLLGTITVKSMRK